MSTRVRDVLTRELSSLRHEPTEKRVRAVLGGHTVVDSTRAMLVWEPRRVVPSYAVPRADVDGELLPAASDPRGADESLGFHMPQLSSRPILDPSIAFEVHTTDGERAAVRPPATGAGPTASAFLPADPDLADYVVLDFDGFDAWLEEDDQIISHPRDPYHRIDVLPSSRHVRLELGGRLLAESSRAHLLFESMLPTRFYLPPDDVAVDLRPSPTRTVCAYKGEASYWSLPFGGADTQDLAWTYEQPRHDAAAVRGLIAFFDERVDVELDGVRRPRPLTPWSRPGTG